MLEPWVALQRAWMYLEPVFASSDIQQQLPMEAKRFSAVDRGWRKTMEATRRAPGVIKARLLGALRVAPLCSCWLVRSCVADCVCGWLPMAPADAAHTLGTCRAHQLCAGVLQPQAAGQPHRIQQAAGGRAEGAVRLLGNKEACLLQVCVAYRSAHPVPW